MRIVTLGLLVTFFGMAVAVNVASASPVAVVSSPWHYQFSVNGTLSEAGSIDLGSPYWWLNSGGYMNIKDGTGRTNEGNLPTSNKWRLLYAANNPTDTDNGYRPQNIFRLVTRSKWQNAQQEALFVIKRDNLSASSNRNQSNGLLLFNRYQDGMNLYYSGIRVDGSAIIKKKRNGAYTTLAEVKGVYPGTYNRDSSPNLLPKNTWIGLRSEVVNASDGSVTIRLYIDKGRSGVWTLAAQATDNGVGGMAITQGGYGGIRTDFMDVQFENFRFKNI